MEQLLDHDHHRADREAPLTAAVGLLTGWLIARQQFPGKAVFEFVLMMSFAIPGTVIGISYIMAFNLPPIQMTGTALIYGPVFCLPQHAGGRARQRRRHGAAGRQPGRGVADAGRQFRPHAAPGDPAAAAAGDRCALVYSFVRAIASI